jgi:hypothetical protein
MANPENIVSDLTQALSQEVPETPEFTEVMKVLGGFVDAIHRFVDPTRARSTLLLVPGDFEECGLKWGINMSVGNDNWHGLHRLEVTVPYAGYPVQVRVGPNFTSCQNSSDLSDKLISYCNLTHVRKFYQAQRRSLNPQLRTP